MKTFSKIFLLPALALALNVRAATNDAAQFSGTVVDAQGSLVADAAVVLYQYPPRMSDGSYELEAKQHATTDSQGAFDFPMFHGQAVVLVTKAGLAPGWRTWYAAVPEEPQKIALGTPSALAGVVVDDAGQPVADAEVWVSAAFNKAATDFGQPDYVSGKIARELFSARTSADGKFRIGNFPADAQAGLSVKKVGKARRQTGLSVITELLSENHAEMVAEYDAATFPVQLPSAELLRTITIIERLREAVGRCTLPTERGPLRITISIGGAEVIEGDKLERLLGRAGEALEAAIHSGGNAGYFHNGQWSETVRAVLERLKVTC